MASGKPEAIGIQRKNLPPKSELFGSGRRIRTVQCTVRANRMSPLARRLRGNRSGMTYVRVRILLTPRIKKKAPTEVEAFWQREKDSNPHKQSQSLLCYLYTIPLSAKSIISKRQQMSTPFFTIFSRTVEKYFSPCYNA